MGDTTFFIESSDLKQYDLATLYEFFGIDVEEEDEDLVGGKGQTPTPLETGTNILEQIFPDIETFLWYLVYQQEGHNKIYQNKLSLILSLINDTRLNPKKFPKSIQVFKDIDAKILAWSKNDVKEVEIDRQISKNSKRKGKRKGKKGSAKQSQKSNEKEAEETAEGNENGSETSSESSGEGDDESNFEETETPKILQDRIKIFYFTIEGRLQMALNDPVIFETILTGPRENKTVSEFVDSPFAHEPNKFSQFLTYQNFAAFDDVKIRHEGKEIYGRIKDFGYRANFENKTVEKIVNIHPYVLRDEIVLDFDHFSSFPVESLKNIVEIKMCKKILRNQQLMEFEPANRLKERINLYQGYDPDTGLYISIFYDKFIKAPTRYSSLGGLYMKVLNQKLKDQKLLENVFLLTLIPNGGDFFAVWSVYKNEILNLERKGVQFFNPKTKKSQIFYVRLGLMKADAPQRCANLDHVGVTASLVCPRCGATKADIWNEKFDCVTCHHRHGLIESIIALKNSLSSEEFEKVKKAFGFHGNNDMYEGMNFDEFMLTAIEPYHLLFLGILRLFFKQSIKQLNVYQRDLVNLLMRVFPFPRGFPKIHFDVTSATKNFSMSIMFQVVLAFPYILLTLAVTEKKGEKKKQEHPAIARILVQDQCLVAKTF